MRIEVEVDIDNIIEESGGAAIIESEFAWILYIPGQVPCICDTFKDAASGMNEWLRKRKKEEYRNRRQAKKQAEQDGRDAEELIKEITRKKEKDGI